MATSCIPEEKWEGGSERRGRRGRRGWRGSNEGSRKRGRVEKDKGDASIGESPLNVLFHGGVNPAGFAWKRKKYQC